MNLARSALGTPLIVHFPLVVVVALLRSMLTRELPLSWIEPEPFVVKFTVPNWLGSRKLKATAPKISRPFPLGVKVSAFEDRLMMPSGAPTTTKPLFQAKE